MTDATVTQADRDAALLDELAEAITDSLDMDWQSRDGARAVMHIIERERTRAAEDMRERCAGEAEAWFPSNTATRYPTGGIVAAIRALPITQEAPE